MRPAEGLVHIYTGDGKGKTTASVGLAVRALGRGLRVAFVQFVKGGAESGELASLRALGATVIRPARRSTGLLGDGLTDEDREAASQAWAAARDAVLTGEYDLVVCDELCVAVAYDLVPLADVLALIAEKPAGVELVLTGRGAAPELVEAADYVTEMVPLKHPYERGVPARRGIEF